MIPEVEAKQWTISSLLMLPCGTYLTNQVGPPFDMGQLFCLVRDPPRVHLQETGEAR